MGKFQYCSQPPWWFIIHAALWGLLGTFIGLHFQDSPSPFKSRTMVMWIFVFVVFTNVGAALYYARSWFTDSTHSKIFNIIGHISASLGSVAFVTLMIPPSVLLPVIFVIWILHLPVYVDISRSWILNVIGNLFSGLFNFPDYVLNIWNRCIGHNKGALI